MKPAKPKQPEKSMASSFARHVDEAGQIMGWTLFRRASFNRRLFRKVVRVTDKDRREMALELLHGRMALRSVVDFYDLQKMGLN